MFLWNRDSVFPKYFLAVKFKQPQKNLLKPRMVHRRERGELEFGAKLPSPRNGSGID